MFISERLNFLWKKHSQALSEAALEREQNATLLVIGILQSLGVENQEKLHKALSEDRDQQISIQKQGFNGDFALNLFKVFMISDPSKNNSALQWLLQCYLKPDSSLLLEDLGEKTSSALSLFAQNRHLLEEEKRTLYKYSGVAEMYSAIKPFLEEKEQNLSISNRELRRKEQAKALEQTTVLGDWSITDPEDFKVKIAVPRSEFAAVWWGKGTRWCTAALKNNYFDRYNKDAPLVVLNVRKGVETVKFQMWVTDESIQFMDEADEKVSAEQILEYWPVLEPVFDWALKINPSVLELVPVQARTRDMCERALVLSKQMNIKAGMNNLQRCLFSAVPKEFIDWNMCKLATEENGNSIRLIPNEFLDKELFSSALANTDSYINYIPDEMFDKYGNQELLEWCAVNNPVVLGYLSEFQTSSLIDQAIINGKQTKHSLYFYRIRSDLITPEICLWAVKERSVRVSDIPEEMRTPEICLAYIDKFPSQIENIPKEMRTTEIWIEALKGGYYSSDDIPPELFTPEFIQQLHDNDALHKYVRLVDQNLISYEMCKNIVKHGEGLNNIPRRFRDREICLIAVRNHDYSLDDVPQEIIDSEICRVAVQRDGAQLENVPDKFITPELCKLACEHCGWALSYVPDRFKTAELCKIALRVENEYIESGSQSLLREVPKELWNREILELAAKHPDSFDLLPDDYRTPHVYAVHTSANPKYLEQVPLEMQEQVKRIISSWDQEEASYRTPRIKWNEDTLVNLMEKVELYTQKLPSKEESLRVFA